MILNSETTITTFSPDQIGLFNAVDLGKSVLNLTVGSLTLCLICHKRAYQQENGA